MKDQVLSINQMQHLKELGIDVSKASMAWYQDYDDLLDRSYSLCELTNFTKKLYNIPTFTLQDMINLMPCEFWATDGNLYELEINNKHIGYVNSMHDYKEPLYYNWNDNLLENAYNMLVWLAENKYI